MREAMRTGDERYLPARDQGAVRRFVRDYVDSCVLAPGADAAGDGGPAVLRLRGSTALATFSNAALPALLLVVLVEVFRLRWKLRQRARRAASPRSRTKGATMYAVMRALQVRFLRQPKPQVKLGQQLPERYR